MTELKTVTFSINILNYSSLEELEEVIHLLERNYKLVTSYRRDNTSNNVDYIDFVFQKES